MTCTDILHSRDCTGRKKNKMPIANYFLPFLFLTFACAFQNKCTQPEDVKLCTWILRPASAGPQRKKVVSFLLHQHRRSFRLPVCISSLPLPPSSLPPPIDPGEGSCGPPPGSGAWSVPAPDRADHGHFSSFSACSFSSSSSSPAPAASSCSSELLRTSPHLAGHLCGTGTSSPFSRDALSADAPPPYPGGRHEGSGGMEGAQ